MRVDEDVFSSLLKKMKCEHDEFIFSTFEGNDEFITSNFKENEV